MMEFTFIEQEWFWLLLLVPLALVLMLYQRKKSLKEINQYRDQAVTKSIQIKKPLMHLFSLLALVVALARPGWNPEPFGVNESGRDMIFLLDVSRSMLAQDVQPDRITAAKNAIRRLINKNPGDRFGIVLFAGTPLLVSPLTSDRLFLNNVLEKLDTDSVSQGGTLINDALMEVLDKMVDEESGKSTDLILISDGEDLGGETDHALVLMDLLGVRLLVVGLGDSQYGARIPARKGDSWTLSDGQEHWSKRDDKKLRELSRGVKQGVYFPVGTDYLDLSAIMSKLQAMWPGEKRDQSKVMKYTEGYPWFLALAALSQFLLLLRLRQSAMTAGLLMLSFNAQSIDVTLSDLEQQAGRHLQAQEYQQAASIFRAIWTEAEEQSMAVSASYNLATSLVLQAVSKKQDEPPKDKIQQQQDAIKRLRMLEEAQRLYRGILQTAPDHKGSARNLELLTMLDEQQRKNQKGRSGRNGQQQQNQNGRGNESQQADNNGEGNSNSPSSGGSDGPSLSDLLLPANAVSAKDVLNDSKKNQQTRSGWRKQSPAERDW